MLDKNTTIKVKNRDNGTVSYVVPDLGNLHRSFQPQEEKEITMDELRKLSYLPGGDVILKDYLVIENAEAVAELLGEVEPEYNYTEAEIEELLKNGTLDQLLDALDFAPEGVVELIKDIAVKTELNDINKRKAILEKTGFNVTSAIDFNKEVAEADEKSVQSRRAAPISQPAAESNNGRRTTIIIPNKNK
jgi:hypothetical protein